MPSTVVMLNEFAVDDPVTDEDSAVDTEFANVDSVELAKLDDVAAVEFSAFVLGSHLTIFVLNSIAVVAEVLETVVSPDEELDAAAEVFKLFRMSVVLVPSFEVSTGPLLGSTVLSLDAAVEPDVDVAAAAVEVDKHVVAEVLFVETSIVAWFIF